MRAKTIHRLVRELQLVTGGDVSKPMRRVLKREYRDLRADAERWKAEKKRLCQQAR